MYDVLALEIFSLYNFTTEDFFFRPQLSYDLADALTFTAGGEYYTGPSETLYDLIDETLNSIFIELKTSF